MDFIDKKEKFADMLEGYTVQTVNETELMNYLEELSSDDEIKGKELFMNIITELKKYLPELSKKELKQRVLLIRSYLE